MFYVARTFKEPRDDVSKLVVFGLGGKGEAVGPGLNFNADDDFLGDGAKPSNLPDFSDLDKQLQEARNLCCGIIIHQRKFGWETSELRSFKNA